MITEVNYKTLFINHKLNIISILFTGTYKRVSLLYDLQGKIFAVYFSDVTVQKR